MSSTTKQPIFLKIMKDSKLLEMKQFTGPQVVMGREGAVDLIVQDPSVSPIHAMVEEREGGKYFICDLGSQSGTFLNGEKIVDEALESGSEFKLGQMTVEFHIGIPKPKKVSILAESAAAAAASSGFGGTSKPASPAQTPQQASTPSQSPPQAQKPQVKPLTSKPVKAPQTKSASEVPKAPFAASEAQMQSMGMQTISSPLKSFPKNAGTYAPNSNAKLNETIKPTKGNTVEIIVSWKDRVLNTYHFVHKHTVQIGSHPNNDIVLPVFGSVRIAHPLVRIDGVAKIFLTSDMTGEVVKEKGTFSLQNLKSRGEITSAGAGFAYTLQQNEVVRLNFGEGVQVLVRYVPQSPESRLLPFLDISMNHLTALVVGLMGVTLFLFYAFLYAPPPPEKDDTENVPPRKALFVYKRPVTEIKPETVAQASGAETIKDKVVAPSRGEEGAASEAKPNNSKSKKQKLTADKASKDSGIQKNKGKSDAAAKSAVKDVNQSGMLSVFGTKGVQDQLNKAYQGSGNVAGLSKHATGEGGEAAGSGNKPGSGLREVGAGGQGTATVGIAGVKTKGRGGGVSGYGTGNLGAKKNASIIAGGDDATFSGSIDKEAIRRVVMANLKQIRACYERGLNKDPGLYGKIVIQWTIGAGGNVLEAGIKTTTMNSSEVENCAVGRLRTWKFPEPPAGEVAVVSYPFVFQAQD